MARRAKKPEAKGKPVDIEELVKMELDGGVTNVRQTKIKHRQQWLGPENRCLVSMTSVSEFDGATKETVWFAIDESRPLARKLTFMRPYPISPSYPRE